MHAQFVSRYHLGNLKERNGEGGLCLDGGVPDWRIGTKELKEVLAWGSRIEEKLGLNSKPLAFPGPPTF